VLLWCRLPVFYRSAVAAALLEATATATGMVVVAIGSTERVCDEEDYGGSERGADAIAALGRMRSFDWTMTYGRRRLTAAKLPKTNINKIATAGAHTNCGGGGGGN
jgi:hypothetical protein